MTPAEVLRRAADVIRERGWCQGSYTDDTGACCAYGAMDAVMDGERCKSAERALAAVVPGQLVATWNDDPRRTKEEVIAALEKAAELAEGSNGV